MNTFKIAIVAFLIAFGMLLISIEVETPVGFILHYGVFVGYALAMYFLAQFTSLFKLKFKFTTASLNLDLIKFLHNEGILDVFLYRLNEQGYWDGKSYVGIEDLVWEDTVEGIEYWKNYFNKFETFYK